MREWIVWLPLPPEVTNRKMGGWRAYHFPRKKWMLNAGLSMLSQLGPDLPKCEKISLALTFHVAHQRDADNLDALRKHIHDLLRSAKGGLGIIPDDTPDHLVPEGFPQQVVESMPRKRKMETDGELYARKAVAETRLGVKLVIRELAPLAQASAI